MAVGKYLLREFYMTGPLFMQHGCTENLLSAGPYRDKSTSSIGQVREAHALRELFQLRGS